MCSPINPSSDYHNPNVYLYDASSAVFLHDASVYDPNSGLCFASFYDPNLGFCTYNPHLGCYMYDPEFYSNNLNEARPGNPIFGSFPVQSVRDPSFAMPSVSAGSAANDSNTYSGFAVDNPTPPYKAERLQSKRLKFGYLDLQRNRRGKFFHIKDMSSKDYILLDPTGLSQFFTNLYDSMLSITTHFHNHQTFLREERTMKDGKKNYTFTTVLEDDGKLTLRIRMFDGVHDNTINIPADFSSSDGCAGWFKFSESLLNMLVESGMNSSQDFENIIEKRQHLQGKLHTHLHRQIDEQVLRPASPNHA